MELWGTTHKKETGPKLIGCSRMESETRSHSKKKRMCRGKADIGLCWGMERKQPRGPRAVVGDRGGRTRACGGGGPNHPQNQGKDTRSRHGPTDLTAKKKGKEEGETRKEQNLRWGRITGQVNSGGSG